MAYGPLFDPRFGARFGVKFGPPDGLLVDDGRRAVPWSVDSLSGKGVPASLDEWTDLIVENGLSLSAPDNLWLMQEASDDLIDSIGGLTLPDDGAVSYSNAVNGWSRAAIGTTDGMNGRWLLGSGVGPNPSTTSVAALTYVRIDVAAAERRVLCFQITSNDWVLVNVTAVGALRAYFDASSAAGSVNYESGAVFPLLLVYDRTNSRCRVYTDQEMISVTYGAVSTDGFKGFGGVGSNPPTARYLYGCWWDGAGAEALSTDAVSKDLLESLGWSVAWSP